MVELEAMAQTGEGIQSLSAAMAAYMLTYGVS